MRRGEENNIKEEDMIEALRRRKIYLKRERSTKEEEKKGKFNKEKDEHERREEGKLI